MSVGVRVGVNVGVIVAPGGGVLVGAIVVGVGVCVAVGVAVEPGGGTQLPPVHDRLSNTPHSLDLNCVQN